MIATFLDATMGTHQLSVVRVWQVRIARGELANQRFEFIVHASPHQVPNTVLTFAFRGSVSDIDASAEDEPFHPSIALVIDLVLTARVIAPAGYRDRHAIAVSQRVVVFSQVYDYLHRPIHVATDLQLDETLH